MMVLDPLRNDVQRQGQASLLLDRVHASSSTCDAGKTLLDCMLLPDRGVA